MQSGARWRAAAVATASFLVVAVVACSAIVDHADSQCATDGDCVQFPGTVCANGGCIAGSPSPEGGLLDLAAPPISSNTCTSTQDCLSVHGGVNWICRHTDGTCVSLLSQDCASVTGSYTSDDAVLIGAILPLDGPHASTGAALADAIKLGVSDFGGGLPSRTDGGLPRPIAVVFCDESDDVDRAAQYLISELDIPIVIGTGDSASTYLIAQNDTVHGGQFLMSPRATANLSAFTSSGLVWRTCPADTLEADAITALMSATIEPALLTSTQQATLRVAIVHATDVESTELDAQISSTLQINGAAATATSNATDFIDVDFGDPDDPSSGAPDYSDAIDAVTQPASLPDAVIILGSTQAVASVLGGIETNWPPTAARRPQYVLSSGLQVPELLTYVSANASVASRILGTSPGSNPSTDTNLSSFLVRYRSTFADGTVPEIFGVAQAYDALYAVTYAASVTRNTDLVGIDVTNALRGILTPAAGQTPLAVDVGPDAISATLDALASGASVTLNGASAPLAFNTQTGDLTTDVQVWCMLPAAGSTAFVFQDSGLSYSASASKLAGTLASGCLP